MAPLKHKSNRYCSVPQCRSRCTSEISLFLFPKDEKLKQKWADALKIKKKISKYMNVCNLHFVKQDFILPDFRERRCRLKKGAIPSQKLPVISSETESVSKELRENETEILKVDPLGIEDSMELQLEPSIVLEEKTLGVGEGVTSFLILDEPSTSSIVDELHDSHAEKIIDEGIGDTNLLKNNSIEKLLEDSIQENIIQTVAPEKFKEAPLDLRFLQEDFANLDEIADSNEKDQTIHRCVSTKLSKLSLTVGREKNKIKILSRLSENGEFQSIDDYLKKLTKEFLNVQMRKIDKNTYVDDWNIKQKRFARSIHKKSPAVYSYLFKYFDLPYKSALMPSSYFDRGINYSLINHLSMQVNQMIISERHCVLLMNDIALSPSDLPESIEIIEQTIHGHEESDELPECCLVFMAKGIQKKWQQVVAYFFIPPSVSSLILKQLIFEVIQQLQKIDLRVVATVCNQESRNALVLEDIIEEDKNGFTYLFEVNNQPICVIYDVPHLLKTTRNALLRCLCEFEKDKRANFDFIEMAFELDQLRSFKMLQKLNKEYFNFEDIEILTDVKVAARQLSYSVAVAIESWQSCKNFPNEAIHTAEFAYKMDCLFDSLNGSNSAVPAEKHLRNVVMKGSPHIIYWSQMLKEMKNWRMIDKTDGTDVTNQYVFIKGWQTTMKSIIYLWETVGRKIFKHFNLRSFNLDQLDNLFRYIRIMRRHNAGNISAGEQIVVALRSAIMYKTLPIQDANSEVDAYENIYHSSFSRNKVNQNSAKKNEDLNFLYSIEK